MKVSFGLKRPVTPKVFLKKSKRLMGIRTWPESQVDRAFGFSWLAIFH